jgi:Beta-lactamase
LEKKQWLVPNRAYSYSKGESGSYQNRFPIDEIVGSTGIFTTIEDIAKWNEELIGGAILGKEIVRQLERTGTITGDRHLEYGDGVVIATDRGLRTIGHGGADTGYVAVLFLYPEYDFEGAILCNTAEIEPWNIAKAIARIYLEEHMTTEGAFSEVPIAQLEKYSGTYYSPARGNTTGFVLKGNQLLAGGNPRFALRELGGSRFQLADIPVYFEFYDDDGAIGLTQSMFGALPDMMLKTMRVEPPTSLSQYVGIYNNLELPQSLFHYDRERKFGHVESIRHKRKAYFHDEGHIRLGRHRPVLALPKNRRSDHWTDGYDRFVEDLEPPLQALAKLAGKQLSRGSG